MVFRPTPMYWISQGFAIVFSFVLVVIGLGVVWPRAGYLVGLAPWLVLTAYLFKTEIMPMSRTYMMLDESGISGRSDQTTYRIYWIETLAADLFRNQWGYYALWIATRRYLHSLPLRGLDKHQIWRQIQSRLGDAIAGKEAYQNWLEQQDQYQAWIKAQEEFIQGLQLPLRTRQKGWLIALGWIGIAFFGGATVLTFLYADPILCIAPVFISFTLLCIPFAIPDMIEMDKEKITRKLGGLRYEIAWEDVVKIDHSPSFDRLIFYGKGKRLSTMGPVYWANPDATAFLKTMTELHKLETHINPLTSFILFQKNTRVRRS
jgi:hypothetical protein